MRRIILISLIGIGALALSEPIGATPTPSSTERVDVPSRPRMAYGLLALKHAEILQGHPTV